MEFGVFGFHGIGVSLQGTLKIRLADFRVNFWIQEFVRRILQPHQRPIIRVGYYARCIKWVGIDSIDCQLANFPEIFLLTPKSHKTQSGQWF